MIIYLQLIEKQNKYVSAIKRKINKYNLLVHVVLSFAYIACSVLNNATIASYKRAMEDGQSHCQLVNSHLAGHRPLRP